MYPRTRASKQASQCYKSNSESMSKRRSEWVDECMGSLERLKNIHFMAGHPQLWLVTQRIGSRCMLKSGPISQPLQPTKKSPFRKNKWTPLGIFKLLFPYSKCSWLVAEFITSVESLTWSALAPWTLSTSNSMAWLKLVGGATEVDVKYPPGVEKYHVNIEY